jgi:hypothetical protein
MTMVRLGVFLLGSGDGGRVTGWLLAPRASPARDAVDSVMSGVSCALMMKRKESVNVEWG